MLFSETIEQVILLLSLVFLPSFQTHELSVFMESSSFSSSYYYINHQHSAVLVIMSRSLLQHLTLHHAESVLHLRLEQVHPHHRGQVLHTHLIHVRVLLNLKQEPGGTKTIRHSSGFQSVNLLKEEPSSWSSCRGLTCICNSGGCS